MRSSSSFIKDDTHSRLNPTSRVYSNDWFMLPHPMDINTVCEIRGILVDDTFGRHTFIRPAGRGPETAWQRWAMFHLTEKDEFRPAANRFYRPRSWKGFGKRTAAARQFHSRRNGKHGLRSGEHHSFTNRTRDERVRNCAA
jgi:hypothetical protein